MLREGLSASQELPLAPGVGTGTCLDDFRMSDYGLGLARTTS